MPRSAFLAGAALLATAGTAQAQTPAAPSAWADSISISAYVQAGITAAPGLNRAARGLNFGHAFTDRANQVLVN